MMKNQKTRENFLMHWGLLEGAKAKIHKYIAREDTGKKTKTGGTQYRYFYTQSAWDKFKKGVSNVANTWKLGVSEIANAGKSFCDAWLAGMGFNTKFGTMNSTTPKQASKRIKDSYSNYSVGSLNPDMWRGAAEGYADMQRGTREVTYTTKSGHAVTENSSGHGKWIAKAKLANGKIRYFYDKKQYERWKEVQTYQDNEPDFMKKYKKIDPHEENGRMPSQKEDYTLTNDRYTPAYKGETDKRYKRTTNCIYCSTAYEMRRRGYDVEATTATSQFGIEMYDQVYKATDGQPVIDSIDWRSEMQVESDGGKTSKLVYEKLSNNSHAVSYPMTEEDAKKIVSNRSNGRDLSEGVRNVSTAKSTITDAFPEGSRGQVGIGWLEGDGHSFIWENTSDGVQFYDAQTNRHYSDSEMQSMLDNSDPTRLLAFIRTDDLEPTDQITYFIKNRETPDAVYNRAKGEFVNSAGDEWYESKRISN